MTTNPATNIPSGVSEFRPLVEQFIKIVENVATAGLEHIDDETMHHIIRVLQEPILKLTRFFEVIIEGLQPAHPMHSIKAALSTLQSAIGTQAADFGQSLIVMEEAKQNGLSPRVERLQRALKSLKTSLDEIMAEEDTARMREQAKRRKYGCNINVNFIVQNKSSGFRALVPQDVHVSSTPMEWARRELNLPSSEYITVWHKGRLVRNHESFWDVRIIPIPKT